MAVYGYIESTINALSPKVLLWKSKSHKSDTLQLQEILHSRELSRMKQKLVQLRSSGLAEVLQLAGSGKLLH